MVVCKSQLCTPQLEVMSKIFNSQPELMEPLHDTNAFNHPDSNPGSEREVVLTPSLNPKSQDTNLLANFGSSTHPWTNCGIGKGHMIA